ncbi:hypothetical protein CEUSTIGMA_g12535.t1 [Chlamydomonas eustigma]|uniref:Uncharacterized protein n=1 Tax=Chlamydomonas eustigma TaxID=1157962 RepID=A0A250XPX5_9CHLO|nr:hypothetical protein CEUSTIGMA_g12535.t1 [Chlamydomonas eustigma]|eukprot:GAX85115.1 hypothetical protein CEUSTIGMA_g12535.t1 [Chlamydomonas eustigma]
MLSSSTQREYRAVSTDSPASFSSSMSVSTTERHAASVRQSKDMLQGDSLISFASSIRQRLEASSSTAGHKIDGQTSFGATPATIIKRPLSTPKTRDKAAVDLSQVLSSLAQVSEQVKRSASATRYSQTFQEGGGEEEQKPMSPIPAAKLLQYKQQLQQLQDTLLQSAQKSMKKLKGRGTMFADIKTSKDQVVHCGKKGGLAAVEEVASAARRIAFEIEPSSHFALLRMVAPSGAQPPISDPIASESGRSDVGSGRSKLAAQVKWTGVTNEGHAHHHNSACSSSSSSQRLKGMSAALKSGIQALSASARGSRRAVLSAPPPSMPGCAGEISGSAQRGVTKSGRSQVPKVRRREEVMQPAELADFSDIGHKFLERLKAENAARQYQQQLQQLDVQQRYPIHLDSFLQQHRSISEAPPGGQPTGVAAAAAGLKGIQSAAQERHLQQHSKHLEQHVVRLQEERLQTGYEELHQKYMEKQEEVEHLKTAQKAQHLIMELTSANAVAVDQDTRSNGCSLASDKEMVSDLTRQLSEVQDTLRKVQEDNLKLLQQVDFGHEEIRRQDKEAGLLAATCKSQLVAVYQEISGKSWRDAEGEENSWEKIVRAVRKCAEEMIFRGRDAEKEVEQLKVELKQSLHAFAAGALEEDKRAAQAETRFEELQAEFVMENQLLQRELRQSREESLVVRGRLQKNEDSLREMQQGYEVQFQQLRQHNLVLERSLLARQGDQTEAQEQVIQLQQQLCVVRRQVRDSHTLQEKVEVLEEERRSLELQLAESKQQHLQAVEQVKSCHEQAHIQSTLIEGRGENKRAVDTDLASVCEELEGQRTRFRAQTEEVLALQQQVQDLKAQLSSEASQHANTAAKASQELSALQEKLLLSEKQRDGAATAPATVSASLSGVGSKRETGLDTMKNHVSLFNDGTETGMARENRMLKERLNDMDMDMHRDRQEYSKSMQAFQDASERLRLQRDNLKSALEMQEEMHAARHQDSSPRLIQDLRSQVKGLTQQRDALEVRLTATLADVQSLNQQLNNLAKDNVQYAAATRVNEGEILRIQTQLEQLEADSADSVALRVKSTAVEAKFEQQQAELASVRAEYELEKRKLFIQIDILKKDCTAAAAQIAQLQGETAQLQNESARARSELDRRRSQPSASEFEVMKRRVVDYEEKLVILHSDVESLSQQRNEYEEAIGSLDELNQAMQTQVDNLTKERETAVTQVRELQLSLTEAKHQVAELQKSQDQKRKQLEVFQAVPPGSQGRVRELEVSLFRAQQQVSALQEKLSISEAEKEQLEEEIKEREEELMGAEGKIAILRREVQRLTSLDASTEMH